MARHNNLIQGDAFNYKLVDIDHVNKNYIMRNINTGDIKILSKEDYEYHFALNQKKSEKPHSGKNNCRRVT